VNETSSNLPGKGSAGEKAEPLSPVQGEKQHLMLISASYWNNLLQPHPSKNNSLAAFLLFCSGRKRSQAKVLIFSLKPSKFKIKEAK